MRERHKTSIAVMFVLEDDGNYLLHLRQNTGYLDDTWSMPGGHCEPGEHVLQTVVREAKEELGVTVAEDDIQLIGMHHTHRNHGQEGLNLYFKIERWQDEPFNAEPDRCGGIQWFTSHNFPVNVNPEVREVIAAKPAHFFIEGTFQPRLGANLITNN